MGASFSKLAMRSRVILPTEGAATGRAIRRPQFTLRQTMIAVAVVALVLTSLDQILFLIVAMGDAVLLGFALYKFARLHFRIRMAVEVATALALLALWVWYSRPPFYVAEANRAEWMAQSCSALAEATDHAGAKMFFREHAKWYDHQASRLRLQALWYGLIRAELKRPVEPLSTQELVRELGILEAMDRSMKPDARAVERLWREWSGQWNGEEDVLEIR
jgi:hypothetical protein